MAVSKPALASAPKKVKNRHLREHTAKSKVETRHLTQHTQRVCAFGLSAILTRLNEDREFDFGRFQAGGTRCRMSHTTFPESLPYFRSATYEGLSLIVLVATLGA